ncbi:MAG: chitobiase/beta-hexosaminidase C-terminal domain-containing protein [Phycisphaerae bacterium]|nr:chitobiase/beta-hexosaminidase C-terminal domain-containing protein [Phycisphaerae bacterium]
MRAGIRSFHHVSARTRGDGLLQAAAGLFGVVGVLYAFGCAPPPAAEAPTFAPSGGAFVETADVKILCATAGATIRYTTDGSEPTASSTEYTAAIQLSETTTIRARAFVEGMSASAITSATFGITSTRLVSVSSDGAEATGGDCVDAAISGDGRYVAFAAAANLVADDTNEQRDVFIHDRRTGQTVRISLGLGGAQTDGDSVYPWLSGDGRYVAFESQATNLVSGDTNDAVDIFVADRQTSQITRVSVSSSAAQADGSSYDPRISPDGRYVAFSSRATNLVGGDTNDASDIFLHDRQTGQTERVSVGSNGAQADGDSFYAGVSADGRYVVFEFWGSNLVEGDTNGEGDILLRDRQTGQTTRVSVSFDGQQSNDDAFWPHISADGRYVSFESRATNLIAGDTNGEGDAFVRDLQTGQTTRVSVNSAGVAGNGASYATAISADGRFVAFQSEADNLVSGDTNEASDIFLHDRQTGQTTRLSVSSQGTQADDNSHDPFISSDGQFTAFRSIATNLVEGGTDGYNDIFVRDRGQ